MPETPFEIAHREADHRAKNSIQLAAALLRLQAKYATSDVAVRELEDASRRLNAIVVAHDLPSGETVSVDEYLARICAAAGAGTRIVVELAAEKILLERERAIPLAMIASEAINNARRHAFPDERPGRIRVSLRKRAAMLLLVVEDDGCGRPAHARDGLGTEITRALAAQLGGSVTISAGETRGCVLSLLIPEQRGAQHAPQASPGKGDGTGAAAASKLHETKSSFAHGSAKKQVQLNLVAGHASESGVPDILGAVGPARMVQPGRDVVEENAPASHVVVILDGMAFCYQTSSEGKRRILSFHFRGDICNVQSLIGPVTYGIAAVTRCKVADIPAATLESLCELHPRLVTTLWRASLREAAILRDWLTLSGERPATPRVAHLLCEIFERCVGAGRDEPRSCAFPLTQMQVAEACGLSAVHVNRIFREFRVRKISTVNKGVLVVQDPRALKRAAHFHHPALYAADPQPGR